ncbi:MAG: ATP-dependent DNA helicase [Deltaproteobacteria bacterium SG8_13]|nr:MAG: ATP-dependent DNA helicase [Deltaproteobacteria bacterium SG8_13]
MKKVFATIGVPPKQPFRPDPFQLQALAAMASADCLVTAPTGAGKTWIAERAIARLLAETGGRAWYASPLKALSNAKYTEFSAAFGADQVGILTGDRKENAEAPVIIGTTEILRNHLYDAMHRGETLNTDLVILDEAHFLGDPERGVVWEEVMIYLPTRIPLLLLSATIGNADQIAAWLSHIRSRPCRVVAETRRPVPLYPLFFHPSGTLTPLLKASAKGGKTRLYKKVGDFVHARKPPRIASPGKLPPFGDILAVLKKYRLHPVIFFLKSRADCDRALQLCQNNQIEDDLRRQKLQRRVSMLVSHSSHMAEHKQRWFLENLAVGSHHSGQLPAWKLILENLMTDGLLDAVFATSTVAAGVNFPARTVVMFNSDRYNGVDFSPLTPTEFHQMTGRAGRRGMDNVGFAVSVPGKFMDLQMIARLLHARPSNVVSQIKINFSMVLNLLLSHSPEQIQKLLERSFATYLLGGRDAKRGLSDPARADRRFLWRDFLRHLEFLQQHRYVLPDGSLTEDGMWASRLRVDQPLLIAEGFRLGALPVKDPVLMAAVVSCFVFEKESDDHLDGDSLPKLLKGAFVDLKEALTPFARQMFAAGFAVRPLFIRPAAAVFAWANGAPWETALHIAEMEEGIFSSLILRIADNLRHIRNLQDIFPQPAASASAAIDLILRDPVSLY